MLRQQLAIDFPALEAMYVECGLTRPEIDAAIGRARGLQAAAQELKRQGRVIRPDQRGEQWVVNMHTVENSYAVRHFYGN
ncbi:MAG: hypothetical protein LBD34_03235 [Puniceicoccales bacterium]|jgi:hypothetical protein|nr:hypothetical protein [Puniceicoccales bacterium]